jgi:hypothetical protein
MMTKQMTPTQHFSPRATLAALGIRVRSLKFFETIGEHVRIPQKTVRHTPLEKLTDAFIAILSGAHGLSEINTRLRADRGVQRAFGRQACAEQSVVQETLDACTEENVRQMEQAVDSILRAHSRAFRHNYAEGLQLLDADMTGLPCGAKAERATTGYFSSQGIRHGRPQGRVVAPRYDEVVVDRLFAGHVQLTSALQPLIEATERTLELTAEQRARTVIRMDAGGGSLDDINWLLERGYQVHGKDISTKRAEHFALSVAQWHSDPRRPGRQMGWAIVKPGQSARADMRRIALRWRKKNGQRCTAMLLSTLEPADVFALLGKPPEQIADPQAVLAAYGQLYDERGGAVEIEIKESKQGLGITKRNKKRFAAQAMVMLLGQLAHNLVVWFKRWLMETAKTEKLNRYGVPRLVRDVLTISGMIEIGEARTVIRITLNKAAPLARHCLQALQAVLKREHISVILGET